MHLWWDRICYSSSYVPIHSGSDMNANLLFPSTSIQSLPSLTTGHDFLHSWWHFLGRHRSVLTIAIRACASSVLSFLSPAFFFGGILYEWLCACFHFPHVDSVGSVFIVESSEKKVTHRSHIASLQFVVVDRSRQHNLFVSTGTIILAKAFRGPVSCVWLFHISLPAARVRFHSCCEMTQKHEARNTRIQQLLVRILKKFESSTFSSTTVV